MTRIRTIAALTVVGALALPSAAFAALKVTGGNTQITASSAATTTMSANHLSVTPLAPATASGSTFTFPISGGRLGKKHLHGTIAQRGGFTISNGTRDVTVRRLRLVSTGHGVWLFAFISKPRLATAAHRPMSMRRVGHLTGVNVKNGSATGKLRLTAFSAGGINALAGKHIARAGTPLGTITVTPSFG